jgi:NADPH-dependent 2,4-dienoyl-CoA reductase/sulfur reductase-like enzyme
VTARPIVIVGASLAGLRAAQALRRRGHDGALVVVGDEPHLPYTRPPLSKELLWGAKEPSACALAPGDLEVEWRLGTAAAGLDLARREVSLAGGETLAYEKLLIATGARARPWPGETPEGVLTLRGLDDAAALKAALAGRPRLAVVGAGFIGCEVASSARRLGLDVTLIDITAQPMPALGEDLGARCAELHRAHGVELRLETGVSGFAGGSRLEGVELADGTRVEADVAVVALGAIPNTDWLADSGLTLQPGVVCDERLQAAEHVFCAGDAAAWPHPMAGGELIRIEHWTNAAEQGVAAAANMLGADEPYEEAPYFWSDQHDAKIQAVGLPARAERTELLEATADGDRFVAAGVRDGRVVAVVGFNAPGRLNFYRNRIDAMPALEALAAEVAADDGALGAPALR